VYLPSPVEKEAALLVIRPAPDEKELTPAYLPAPVENESASLVIGPAPDDNEQAPVYLPAPVEKEPAPWGAGQPLMRRSLLLCTYQPLWRRSQPQW